MQTFPFPNGYAKPEFDIFYWKNFWLFSKSLSTVLTVLILEIKVEEIRPICNTSKVYP